MEVKPQESLTRLDLPEEIWINIFRSLDNKSVQNAQLVCKKWLDFILNDVILSGEYRFATGLPSSTINSILAKRKKLKSVHFLHPYEYKVGVGVIEDETIFDYVDFKVCKDLKKVTFQMYNKIAPFPRWIGSSSFWFDPYNMPESFGPENTLELTLRIMHGLQSPDESSIELVTKKMTQLEKLKVYLYGVDNIDYLLPLLKGLQRCHSLHELEIFCQPGDVDILSLLLHYISEWCPRISYLKMEPQHDESNEFKSLEWCSSITKFRNLEKLEIGLYLVPSKNWQEDGAYLDMDGDFYRNPMTKLKELKLNTVNVFFQDSFLHNFQRFFPNLQTFNLTKLGHQGVLGEEQLTKKISCWAFSSIRETLRCLGSIENLCLPSMEIVLEPWSGMVELTPTFRKTERIFYQATDIIGKEFPLSIGDLKIIDDKHGFVILKEKMKPPKMFNQQQISGRSIVRVEHFEDSKTVKLKLKPKRQKGKKKTNEKHEKEDEVVLSGELIKRLYLEHIAKSSKYT